MQSVESSSELLVRASVWLAVLCYPAGPAMRLGASRLLRLLWTLGALAFLVHVASAFHLHYAWSHAVAVRETARQSGFGAGIWINYLFTVLWVLDVAWCWWDPAGHRRRNGWIDAGLHAFLLFVLFNGAVVFAHGPVRALGLASTLLGILILVRHFFGEDARETT